ncbi:AzlC family ABC transporter permease [Acidimangrovimonas sediminis]|uniref:AzlC family ABC transporter permease n=1 Tax=Acidimangrovimonas sediminis TaxID=2056283 RepID=UPI000C803234|nr:AzlC family ABC transporter permease [Acidimangrovimonas sediminis]
MPDSPRSHYLRGLRDGAPFIFVVAPFGMLFGMVATEAGLPLTQVMGFSVLVIAGAAQFAALQLMKTDATTAIVLATALAVNLRMAMYSAAMAPHLGAAPIWKRAVMAYFLVDQTYAASALEFERHPSATLSQKIAFFAGVATFACLPWYGATYLGATLGSRVPPELALDFAMPITFLAMIAPMMRTAAHVAAVAVSVAAALVFAFLPYNLGLLVAAVLAMAAGARVEQMSARRRAAA